MDEEFLWWQNHAIVDLIELVGEDELFIDGLNSIDDDTSLTTHKITMLIVLTLYGRPV